MSNESFVLKDKREKLFKDMKESIGNEKPMIFFEKFLDVFSLFFRHLEKIQSDLDSIRTNSALAIQWEPKVASDMLAKQIEILRQDKDGIYQSEITECKIAYGEDKVTQNYNDFCNFWVKTLGWHPFLDYSN